MPEQLRSWMSQWAWGTLSAARVVENAKSYMDDHHDTRGVDPRVIKLAKTHRNIQNAERVIEQLVPTTDMPQTVVVNGSMVNKVLPL